MTTHEQARFWTPETAQPNLKVNTWGGTSYRQPLQRSLVELLDSIPLWGLTFSLYLHGIIASNGLHGIGCARTMLDVLIGASGRGCTGCKGAERSTRQIGNSLGILRDALLAWTTLGNWRGHIPSPAFKPNTHVFGE